MTPFKMNKEQLQRLYEQARLASQKRLLKEKAERRRVKTIQSAENYLMRKSLVAEEKRKLKAIKDKRRKLKTIARKLLQLYTKWLEELERSLLNPELKEWQIFSKGIMIDRLQQDVLNLKDYLDSKRYNELAVFPI